MAEPATGRVGVILCRCPGEVSQRIDLAEVCRYLKERPGVAAAIIADDLCHRADAIKALIAQEALSALVLGACAEEEYRRLFQEKAREAGLDPFVVEIANLRDECALVHPYPQATAKAKLMVLALAHRAALFPGTSPANLRPRFLDLHQKISRRALFTLARPRYEVVPHIDAAACVASQGCRLCLPACPLGAISAGGDRVVVEKDRCEGCGACVAECPTGAICFPTFAPAQLESQMWTLLVEEEPLLQTRLLALVCRGSAPLLDAIGAQGLSYPPSVLPLALPCLAMASPSLILRALSMGAAGVALVPCPGECRYGLPGARLEGRLDFLQELLGGLRVEPERVKLLRPAREDPAWLAAELGHFAARLETLGASALAEKPTAPWDAGYGLGALLRVLHRRLAIGEGLVISHPACPLGQVEIAAAGCTGCALCAAHCPTKALLAEEGSPFRLTFDAAACVACGDCERRCPEQVVKIERKLVWDQLGEPRRLLVQQELTRCRRCGKPFAPAGMVERVRQRVLQSAGPANLKEVLELCPNCRIPAYLAHRGGLPSQEDEPKGATQ